ncbi:MAG: hypothetical protein AAFY43_03350 [Pseudomonadota bacterium]
MDRFSADEIKEIDRLWRAVPPEHVWSGWAAAGETPREIWIFRTKAHWRRFPLKKSRAGYALFDEREREVANAPSLEALLRAIEAIPGIEAPYER